MPQFAKTEGLIKGLSFFTNCYEADWEFILKEGRLQEMIKRCKYPFTYRGLVINNVKDKSEVEYYAKIAVELKIIDAYYFTDDYSGKILSKFSISRKSFKQDLYDGYWYSIGPLAAIYLCVTSHLLYFTCDCMLQADISNTWIDDIIELLEKNSNIIVGNPLWDNKFEEAAHESFKETESWYFGQGFSDQCFLIKTESFSKNIYNEYHLSSEQYPVYAGNLFEKRVHSYMRKKSFERVTSKKAYYIHEKLAKPDRLPTSNYINLLKKVKRIASNLIKRIRIEIKLILNR